MSLVEVLEKALEFHKANPWTKGSMTRECKDGTAYCALGAVLYSLPDGTYEDFDESESPRAGHNYTRAHMALDRAAERLSPPETIYSVVRYNDRFAKTKEDVTKLFELALEEAKKAEKV